ncbi:MAG: hypothetical protein QM734_05975 [Cyclobacteriaceae bacterium]
MKTKEEFQAQYQLFVEQFGVLYEEQAVPMDESDFKKTKQFYWVIAFFVVFYLTLGGIAFYFNQSKGITVGMILFALVFVLVVGVSYFSVNKALKEGKKSITKGVVTLMKDKYNSKEAPKVCLSDRNNFSMNSKDFVMLSLGDVIQIEKVGTFIPFVQRVTKLGTIFDPESMTQRSRQ